MTRAIKFSFAFLIWIAGSSNLRAQQSYCEAVLAQVLYDVRIHEKVFFKYVGDSSTFLNGYHGYLGSFILTDKNLFPYFPDLLDRVGTAHGTENQFLTITFLSRPEGSVYITSHIGDPHIKILIDLDELKILQKKASVKFHTTSVNNWTSLGVNYIKVECQLIKKRSKWKVEKVEISPSKWISTY